MDEDRRERHSAGAVAGGKTLAVVGMAKRGAEEFAGMLATGADAPEQPFDDHARHARREDRDNNGCGTFPTIGGARDRIELPGEDGGDRRADGLPVLGEPAGFALDVAFEGELEGGRRSHSFENEQDDADDDEGEEEREVHVMPSQLEMKLSFRFERERDRCHPEGNPKELCGCRRPRSLTGYRSG